MPTGRDGVNRVHRIDGGLYERANPLLIMEDQLSSVLNFDFNRQSAEQSSGMRKLNALKPKMGAPRLVPHGKRTTAKGVTVWRDGYLFAPMTSRLRVEPHQIDIHVRINQPLFFPSSGVGPAGTVGAGLTGRDGSVLGDTIGADQRRGGEHQFFPIVSRGARDIEGPWWSLGIGCVYPEGLASSAGAFNRKDGISPVFLWWDPALHRVRVAAADFLMTWNREYAITARLGPAGAGDWWVDGVATSSKIAFGIEALPAAGTLTRSDFPIYFGRCFPREPDIYYDAATGHQDKHAFMGKYDVQVTGAPGGIAGAITLPCINQELATAAGTPYVNYRARMTTGAAAGTLYPVNGVNTPLAEATIQLVIDAPLAHGILQNDLMDVVPAAEPMPLDASIQEVRLWNARQADSVVQNLQGRQAVSDPNSTSILRNALVNPAVGSADENDIIAYWPMNDDGGLVCRDMLGRSDAFFAPSRVAVDDETAVSASPRVLWLDGDTEAVQVDLREDPNFSRNHAYNLGKTYDGKQHWNFCARMQLLVGGQGLALAGGAATAHSYQVLFSLGDPENQTVVLEARITNHGAGANPAWTLYFLLPDGTFQAVPILDETGASIAPTVGVWYNAILGIEALDATVAEPNRHYAYFQAMDAAMNPVGGFSAGFELPSGAFQPAGKEIDPEKEYMLSFGASVGGDSEKGAHRHHHAMLGLGCLGYGFHPAHIIAAAAAPSSGPMLIGELAEWIRFDPIERRDETRPSVAGAFSGVSLDSGSNAISDITGEDLSPAMRRWPIELDQFALTLRKEGEADLTVPDNVPVSAVSGATATLVRAHSGSDLQGAELRLRLWAGYTAFEIPDLADDLDLNAGRAEGEDWARTPDVIGDIAEAVAGLDMALDPHYEFVSPIRISPRWGEGLVRRADIEISGVFQIKLADGRQALLAVVGGTLFEVDDRWRRGDPFGERGIALEFRHPRREKILEIQGNDEGVQRYGAATTPLVDEAIVLDDSDALKPYIDPTFAPVARTPYVWEADIRLGAMDGVRTIGGAGLFDAATTIGYDWTKNWHFFANDGHLGFEIRSDSAAVLWRMETAYANGPVLRPERWHRVLCEIYVEDPGGGQAIVGGSFMVDGRHVQAVAVDANLLMAAVPNFNALTGRATLGAIGFRAETGVYAGLGGRIACFRMVREFPYGSSGGQSVEYNPAPFAAPGTASTAALLLLDEGQGARVLQYAATNLKRALVFSRSMVHIGSGMGDTTGRQVAIEAHSDIAYLTTGLSRPWRFDLDRGSFTPVGLRPPAGKLGKAELERRPFRIRGEGADLPSAVGVANKCRIQAAAPHIFTFAGAAPTPGAVDEGCLVHIPADPDFGTALPQPTWPPGFIATISAADAATPGYSATPAPINRFWTGALDASWSLFRKYRNSDAVAAASRYKLAILNGPESTTPWSGRRLLGDGKDDTDAPREEDGLTVPAEGNAACQAFRGNRFLEVPPFAAAAMPVAQGKVLDVKGYLRLDDVDTLGDDQQVVFEKASGADSGSYRIAVVDGGRLQFEFYDTKLGAMRSISTTGKVLSAKQWHYVRFRYRFKAAGAHVFDTDGGWEPDLRWTRRGVVAPEFAKANDFRDYLCVVACEGLHRITEAGSRASDPTIGYFGDVFDPVSCPFLTLPGCESQVGGAIADGTPAAWNHSQELLNVGLLRSAPYLTPERGDGLFPAAFGSSLVDSGIEITLQNAVIQGLVTAVGGAVGFNFTMPAGFVLPRMCSMNRDDAWNRRQDSSATTWSKIWRDDAPGINENYLNDVTLITAGQGEIGYTPNLVNFGIASGGGGTYGKQEAWAVLCRVWNVTADGSGSGVVAGNPVNKAAGDPARVLALVHLGESDIGAAARAGVAGHRIYLTDDTIYGGDGLGALVEGATPLQPLDRVHVTFELMNGLNQSVNSQNRNVVPSLLEQGDNPVGVDDSPDQSLAPMRFGGTVAQAESSQVKNGLKGRMDEWGVLVADLDHSTGNVYTTDMMPPDAFFHGPADCRFQSLPRLAFMNNAAVLDVASGAAATRATLVMRMDELGGDVALADGRSPAWSASQYSDGLAPNGIYLKKSRGILSPGEHRLRATFYDPEQGVESNPGEETVVRVDGDDGSGDPLDAESTFAISGLPVSGDHRRRVWRRLYKTFGGAATPFLWAEIKDDSLVVFTPTPDFLALATGQELQFDNDRPPVCAALVTSETNMFYVGVDDAPNVIAISKAFDPDHVPGTRILYGESGKGGGLIACGYLRGLLVPAKRNAIFVAEPAGGAFSIRRVGQSVGCLSHGGFADMDGMLFFPSQKGVYVFVGNQRTHEASGPIENLYRRQIDLRRMDRAHGAAHLDRGQYLLTAHAIGAEDPQVVLTTERRFDEFGNNFYVWGIVNHDIPFFSLAEYEERFDETSKVAMGSRGFVHQYDTGDGVGTGRESFLQGGLVGTVGAGSGLGFIALENMAAAFGGIDDHLDGLAGIPVLAVQEQNVNGGFATPGQGSRIAARTDEVVLALRLTDTTATVFARDASFDWSTLGPAGPVPGQTVVLGGFLSTMATKWFASGFPETEKSYRYIDLFFDAVVDGVVFVDLLGNFNESTVLKSFRVPLTRGFFKLPCPEVGADHLQLVFRAYGHRTGFVLHQFQIRGEPHGWGKRQKE